MSDPAHKQISEKLFEIYSKTDEALSEWDWDKNMQIPTLVSNVGVKLNWSPKQMRKGDGIIRFYLDNHPDWHVTRGAHGGIMKADEKNKKELAKLTKASLKKQMADTIDASLKQKDTVTAPSSSNDDEDDLDSSESTDD